LYLASQDGADAFVMAPKQTISVPPCTSSTLFNKARKARRDKERQSRERSKQFYDAIEEASGKKDATALMNGEEEEANGIPSAKTTPDPADDPEEARRNARMADAQQRYDTRPEVSAMIIDEETGTEVLAQGQKVMDVITRKAVKLSDKGPGYRLAQMFPGVPPEVRAKYRFDWTSATVPQMVEQLKDACSVKLEDGTQGIPPHPSVANKAIDFVLANRDFLGLRMKKTLARWAMHHASKGDIDAAKEWQKVFYNFLTIENHVSAPFRQIMQDAEGRVGPNFGNLDLKSFCRGKLYERVGNYLVLKGMVAHWEKKLVDANTLENMPYNEDNFFSDLLIGDPKRFITKSTILFTLRECTQVCAMAQQMCQAFTEDEELFADFPPEIVFLEEALKITGGTALRKYMIEEFCPSRDITPEGLREGMRRLYQQLANMQVDPYADIARKVEQLYKAMAVGTDDARDPYEDYLGVNASLDPNNPAYIETYTFNYSQKSILAFLDDLYPGEQGFMSMVGPQPTQEESEESSSDNPFDFGNLFGGLGLPTGEKQLRTEPKPQGEVEYITPKLRASGRRHNLGWFEKLNKVEEGKKVRMNDVKPGRIIPDDEA
jgi:hypothetical protein